MLDDVKLLLGIDGDERDELLSLLIANAETQVLGRLQGLDLVPKTVPDTLAYIIPELVVARFNRIGSEGLSQESVEGYSATYNANDLSAYESVIEDYLNQIRVPKTGIVRFI